MKVKLSTIRSHPDNPRVIKDSDYQSLKKSIILFPEMQTARPMVVNSSNQIIGGNQRRRAFQDIAGMTLDEISAVIGTSTTPIEPERVTFLIEFWDNFKTEKTVEVHKVDWSEAKQKEFMIKDNVSNGDWDYNELANSWDSLELNDWGVGVWEQEEQTDAELNNKYTQNVTTPIYEPKNEKPDLSYLYNIEKTNALIQEIENSSCDKEIKQFLIFAAQRHTVFNYELIADYYAHADVETQNLMENSALVIIDFKKAIELGYVQLSEEIKEQYLSEYGDAE